MNKVWLVIFNEYEDSMTVGIGDSLEAAKKIANRHFKVNRPEGTPDLIFGDSFIHYGCVNYSARIGNSLTIYLEECPVESLNDLGPNPEKNS
jgi:hypothetical protein